jgi:phage head maturation protease
MSGDIEYLTTPGTVECRGGTRSIGGMALTFGTRSKPIGGRNGYIEVVSPSFIKSAKDTDYRGIIARYSHMDQYLLGATDSRTLRISDNARGLDYTVDVPEYHSWVYDSVARGDCRASSFSFVSGPDESDWDHENGMMLRTLRAGVLLEVSPTPIGQYPDASVGLRSGLASLAAQVDAPIEDVMRHYERGELRKFVIRTDGAPPTGMDGKRALALTMDASPAAGAARSRQKLLQAMDESPGAMALRTSVPEAIRQLTEMAKPPVICMTEMSVEEIVARAEAESVARELAEVRSYAVEPQRRTLTGREALQILDSMKPVEPPSNLGRACDQYGMDQGGRF